MPEPCWIGEVERRMRSWLARRGPGGATGVVAVSGGGDSVGLLRVLHMLGPQLDLRLVVAHLDHGTRGEASRADAAFVEDLARTLGLPFVLGHWSPARSTHFEVEARRARLAFLERVAVERGASVVALGHTRDDQAETVLHRVARGTGPRGLAGIPARRRLGPKVELVRPLLTVSRAEVRAELTRLEQAFREDATNADLAQTRARIRHDLLPRLEAGLNPHVAEALARLARQSASAWSALLPEIRRVLRGAARQITEHRVVLDREALRRSPAFVRREVMRRAWRRAGWPEGAMSERRWRRLDTLVCLAEESASIDVGQGVSARTDSACLVLERPGEELGSETPPDPQTLSIPGMVAWPGGRVVASVDDSEPHDERIDLGRLVLPLVVRGPRPGDRFDPLGLDGHTQPLKDLLRRSGVPPERRSTVPLVCDAAGIVWVVGHRISERVRRTDATTRVVGLRWEGCRTPTPG